MNMIYKLMLIPVVIDTLIEAGKDKPIVLTNKRIS